MMGYILVVFVFLMSGEPAQVAPRHFPTVDACLAAKDSVPAFIREANDQISDPEGKAVGYAAECVPFKNIPAGPST
jgi:hypothetical protein